MLAVVMSVTSTFLKKEGEDRIDQFIMKVVSSVTPPAAVSTNTNPSELGAPPTEDEPATGTDQAVSRPDSRLSSATNATRLPAFAQAEDAVQARRAIAKNINQFIQNTRSGALGVTGSVLLIFAAISMLSRIEATFNDIWGVSQGRGWFMRIVLYWGVISLAPLLVVVAVGLASGPQLESTKEMLTSMPMVSSLVFRLLPVVLLCLIFGVFYMLMPNAKVDWRAALMGGLVAGLLFHLNNMISVLYVSRVVSNSKIYGSLGLVPVFMMGLYFSWVILLFGAQVAYAFQNRTTYLEEKQVENINQRGREFVALRLITAVGLRFGRGEAPPTVSEMAEDLAVPSRLIRQIMQTLGAARLVVETSGAETAYLPARPLEQITCHDLLLAMRAAQGHELSTRDEPMRGEVLGEFQRIQDAERAAAGSVTLLDLVNRAQGRLLPGNEIRAAT